MKKSTAYFESVDQQRYPPYILQRLKSFYQDRVGKEWGGRHLLRGAVPAAKAIDLTSNDYLRLSVHKEVVRSQLNALKKKSQTPLMSASFIYGEAPQSVLERRFASFFESEAAVLCQSGYVANLGLMQTLVEDQTVPVYVDMMAHMSLWDGIRLGGGKIVPFLHNNLEHLERKIEQSGSGIIVIDAVYSTDGSVAPLTELAELTKRRSCILVVDESHSFGTHGPQGKGLVISSGIKDIVMFRTASLAKAFASRAGLILCPKEFYDFFGVTSKPQIFSSALMPVDIAGLSKVLDLISSEMGEQRRACLTTSHIQLRTLLEAAGIDVSESKSQIISLKTHSEGNLLLFKELLGLAGVLGAAFATPATPKKRPVLRLSLHAELKFSELEYISEICKKNLEILSLA